MVLLLSPVALDEFFSPSYLVFQIRVLKVFFALLGTLEPHFGSLGLLFLRDLCLSEQGRGLVSDAISPDNQVFSCLHF